MATRKTYSKVFKIEAVRLLGLGEKPASQLALELGIRRNQLYKWRDQIKGDGAFRGPGRKPASDEDPPEARAGAGPRGAEYPKKSGGVLCEGTTVKYALIQRHAEQFPIARQCALLGVSRSGYYEWRGRPESRRRPVAQDHAASGKPGR